MSNAVITVLDSILTAWHREKQKQEEPAGEPIGTAASELTWYPAPPPDPDQDQGGVAGIGIRQVYHVTRTGQNDEIGFMKP